jgi:glycosyltransferase involved in cell wall biosynthesis
MTRALTGHRVLVISRSTTAHPGSGGMETSAASLIRAFHELGALTSLLTTELPDGLHLYEADDHVHTWTIRTPKPGRYSRSWWRTTSRPGPWDLWNPTMVVSEGDSAAEYLRRATVPVIVHAHGTTLMEARSALGDGLRGILKACLNLARTPHRNRFLRGAARVLSAGASVQHSLQMPPYSLPPERLMLLANSVATDEFSFSKAARLRIRTDLALPVNATVMLNLGRLTRDKGVETSIRVLTHMPNAHLVIAGDGPSASKLERLSAALGLQQRVHFLGKVTSEVARDLLNGSDCLIFPTRRLEGFPMVILEAAAAGLPIVTTKSAHVPAPFPAERVQTLDPSASVAEFATAVTNVLISGERASYLPAEYSIHTLPWRLMDTLEDLLEKK